MEECKKDTEFLIPLLRKSLIVRNIKFDERESEMTQPQQEEKEEEGTQRPLVLDTIDGLESAVEEDNTVS